MLGEVLKFESDLGCVTLSLGYVTEVLSYALIAFAHLYSNIIYSVKIDESRMTTLFTLMGGAKAIKLPILNCTSCLIS